MAERVMNLWNNGQLQEDNGNENDGANDQNDGVQPMGGQPMVLVETPNAPLPPLQAVAPRRPCQPRPRRSRLSRKVRRNLLFAFNQAAHVNSFRRGPGSD